MGETADVFLCDLFCTIFPREWHAPATENPPVRVQMRAAR